MLSIVWWVMTCPPEAVFGVSNPELSDGAAITALTTTGLFQMNVNDALQRIILSIGIGALLIGFITHIDEQARLASLGVGASFLAHDMRNLLASLHLNAEQLVQMPGEKEQRIGKRLSNAIEQAMSLAEWATLYTSHKRDNSNVSRQKLEPVIADALNFVRLHDPKRRVQLINECDANVEVVAETTLMFRIVYNLVLNAMQSMKAQSGHKRITIEARSDDQACTLYVSDTGPGLPNAGAGTLLMPHMSGFGRPDGTGLGLKIVVDLLSWHGGKIEVARADSHGTHFKITIPHDTKNAPRDDVLAHPDPLDASPVEG